MDMISVMENQRSYITKTSYTTAVRTEFTESVNAVSEQCLMVRRLILYLPVLL